MGVRAGQKGPSSIPAQLCTGCGLAGFDVSPLRQGSSCLLLALGQDEAMRYVIKIYDMYSRWKFLLVGLSQCTPVKSVS